MQGFRVLVSTLVLTGASVSLAQSPTAPPVPPVASQRLTQPGPPARDLDDVAVASLARNIGVSAEQAKAHVQLARRLFRLTDGLDPDQLPTLAGVYLDAQPTTMLTILYSGDANALRSRVNVPGDLAAHVRFVPANLPLRALIAQQQRFLRSRGLQGLKAATYIDQRANRIVVQVENGVTFEQRQRAGSIDLPENVKIEVGPLPTDLAGTQPSTGFPPQSGDFIEGGRVMYQWNLSGSTISAPPECTLAYGAKWGTVYGILTAGHCEPGNYGTGYAYPVNNHWVELWGPDYESNNQTTKYDFQFHRTPGMKVYNTVAIINSSGTVDRWLYVWGTHARLSQWVGYPMCKYGRVTLYECFNLTDNNYYFKNEAGYTTGPWGYIQSTRIVAEFGDSGGSVMDVPDGGYINARGIISRGGYNSQIGAYQMIYMPIDHIDDVYPISVLYANGLQSWGG